MFLDCNLFYVLECELDISAVKREISFLLYVVFLWQANHVIFNFSLVSLMESLLITL